MDIGSRNPYPAGALSNFAPHPFVYRLLCRLTRAEHAAGGIAPRGSDAA